MVECGPVSDIEEHLVDVTQSRRNVQPGVPKVCFCAFYQGHRKRVRTSVKKYFSGLPNKGRLAKSLNTKTARLTVSCSVTRAWSGRVNLCSRQAMTLPRETEIYVI